MRVPVPTLLGHEAAGVVEAVGTDVSTVAPGDHVVVCLSMSCGACNACAVGRPSLCSRKPGRGKDAPPAIREGEVAVTPFAGIGAFAEEMLLSERAVVAIDREVPLDRAALIGCAVTTGLGAVFNTARVRPGSIVAVIGCGGIGLNVVRERASLAPRESSLSMSSRRSSIWRAPSGPPTP
jgi:S-(hydroxymethyl)glutathione dehydrogenase/alcohol dehydrogenase